MTLRRSSPCSTRSLIRWSSSWATAAMTEPACTPPWTSVIQMRRWWCHPAPMPCSAPRPTPRPPSAMATSRQSQRKDGWPGSATAAIINGPVSRASSPAGSRSSVTGCASTSTRPAPPRSPSRPRSSTECSTLDARTPSASPDQQRGRGPPLPPPSKAVGLARIMHGRWRVYRTWLDSRRIQSPNTNPTGIRRPPAMVDTTLSLPGLSPVRSKPLDIRFDGGVLSSDGGLLLFREVEERLRLADCLAGWLKDPRNPAQIDHTLAEIIRFRMLAIVAGYEDANDCNTLRHDPIFKIALGRLPEGGRDLVLAVDGVAAREPAVPDGSLSHGPGA